MAVSTGGVRVAAISAEPLDLDAHLRAVDDPHMGAVTTFGDVFRFACFVGGFTDRRGAMPS